MNPSPVPCSFRRAALWLAGLLLLAPIVTAQEPKLKPTDPDKRVFRHEEAKTTFTAPKDWEVLPPRQVEDLSVLHLRRGDLGMDVTITWVPVYIRKKSGDPSVVSRDPDVEATFKEELANFQLIYGKDKVQPNDPVAHPNGKSATAFRVLGGPRRNEKEEGYVLLFDSGPDPNTRWKVMIRANFQKKNKEEDVADRLAVVADLFKKNFQW